MNAHVRAAGLHGSVEAISSKSQLQRQIICAMLADAPTEIRCRGLSEDVLAALRCAEALGAHIERDTDTLILTPGHVPQKEIALDCGMSAAVARFMLPVAAALQGNFTLTGQNSLLNRPMDGLKDALESHGCFCSSGTLPMQVMGRLTGGDFTVPVETSSQYLSGLLLASPVLNVCRIHLNAAPVSRPYIDLTLDEMARFGIAVQTEANGYFIPAGQHYTSPGIVRTEGDWSAAALWLCASALTDGAVEVADLSSDSLQGDRKITEYIPYLLSPGEKTLDMSDTPDLFPVLAVLACAVPGKTAFRNIDRLRTKESDRVESVLRLLKALGGSAEAGKNTFAVCGGALHGGTVDACGDHRIVMAAVLAALLCKESVMILDADSVRKSYPGFWEDFAALGGEAEME